MNKATTTKNKHNNTTTKNRSGQRVTSQDSEVIIAVSYAREFMNCVKEELAALGSLTPITVRTVSVGVKSNTEPESLESTKL